MQDLFNQFQADVQAGKLNSSGTPNVVEVNDPTNYAQCMDLAYAWCDRLGIPRTAISHYYAYQVWSQPLDSTIQYFEYLPNTPNGVPHVGDLVVFKAYTGGTGIAGHISIATGQGGVSGFNSYDQNWGTIRTCRVVTHNYDAVYGWLRKREQVSPGGVTDQSLYDFGQDFGVIELQAGRSKLQEYKSKVNQVRSIVS